MSHLRLLSLAIAGIGGFLYKSFSLSRRNNIFKVSAEPGPEYFEATRGTKAPLQPLSEYTDVNCYNLWDIENYKDDLEKRQDVDYTPLSSTPIKKQDWNYAFKGDVTTHERIRCPTIDSLQGKVFDISCNKKTGMPDWTVEVVTADRFKKCPKCQSSPQCALEFEGQGSRNPSFHAGCVPTFESYCAFDIEPCFFQLSLPQIRCKIAPNFLVWHEFYNLVKTLIEGYEHIYICSGPVFKKSWDDVEYISQYFKVLVGKNQDGTFLFQCFLIDNIYECWDILEDFEVSRKELEQAIGFSVFPDIRSRKMNRPNPCWQCLNCFLP